MSGRFFQSNSVRAKETGVHSDIFPDEFRLVHPGKSDGIADNPFPEGCFLHLLSTILRIEYFHVLHQIQFTEYLFPREASLHEKIRIAILILPDAFAVQKILRPKQSLVPLARRQKPRCESSVFLILQKNSKGATYATVPAACSHLHIVDEAVTAPVIENDRNEPVKFLREFSELILSR